MIDNKMVVDQINLKELQDIRYGGVIFITQEEYDLLQIKEPTTIYKITDAEDGRVYLGEHLIVKPSSSRKYLLGPANTRGEYIMYLNEVRNHQDCLLEIARYSDPQKAIDALNRFNRTGCHTDLALQTRNLLIGYIQKDLNIHDLLIGLIALFGYRDDIRLQQLIAATISLGTNKFDRDFSVTIRDTIAYWNGSSDDSLYKFYAKLYDVVVFYDHFKDRKFHREDPEDIDLAEVIDRMLRTVISRVVHSAGTV